MQIGGMPAADPPGTGVGPLGYRLGVVGERSSGDEAPMRVVVERGEVRIPE